MTKSLNDRVARAEAAYDVVLRQYVADHPDARSLPQGKLWERDAGLRTAHAAVTAARDAVADHETQKKTKAFRAKWI